MYEPLQSKFTISNSQFHVHCTAAHLNLFACSSLRSVIEAQSMQGQCLTAGCTVCALQLEMCQRELCWQCYHADQRGLSQPYTTCMALHIFQALTPIPSSQADNRSMPAESATTEAEAATLAVS